MSSRVRYGILFGLVGLALAILGFFFLSRMVRETIAAPALQPTPEAQLTQKVVVTTHDVTLGTVLKAEDLRIADMPADLVPAGVMDDPANAIGKFPKVDLVSGETVLEHHLADPTNVSHDIAYVIQDNEVMMAFPTNDLMSTLNVLQRGDLVDILVSFDQEVDKPPDSAAAVSNQDEKVVQTFTLDAMQRIEISALVVEVVTGNNNNKNILSTDPEGTVATPAAPTGKVKAYLLALNTQDALVLKHLKDIGATFDFVLRSPTSNQLYDLNPVTSQYLNDRYQLQGAP